MPRIADSELNNPQPGNIQLIVVEAFDDSPAVFLEIPIEHITPLCVRPRKYLRYLGWAIMGIERRVARVSPNPQVDIGDEGALESQNVYAYRNPTTETEGISLFHWPPHF
jgi:hypothetical protein